MPHRPRRKESIKSAAAREVFDKGIILLKESKHIENPDMRAAAQSAALKLCVGDAIVPLSRSSVMRWCLVLTVTEAALAIVCILKLKFALSSAIIGITIPLWFVLVAITLALGDVLSQNILAKLMTTAFGQLVKKASQIHSILMAKKDSFDP